MSYLSPHVNMSARLEGLTKTYKKPFLFTRSIYNLIETESIRKLCRKLDYVTVYESGEVTELFTIELNQERLREAVNNPSTFNLRKDKKLNIKSNRNMKFENITKEYLMKE